VSSVADVSTPVVVLVDVDVSALDVVVVDPVADVPDSDAVPVVCVPSDVLASVPASAGSSGEKQPPRRRVAAKTAPKQDAIGLCMDIGLGRVRPQIS
jgi:hypothetical protein